MKLPLDCNHYWKNQETTSLPLLTLQGTEGQTQWTKRVMDQGREAHRGMAKAHASKQIPRSPGKLELPTGLDLVGHWRQGVDELGVLGLQREVAVAEVEVAVRAVWVCQLHPGLCRPDLWCAAAGPPQSAAERGQRERQKDVQQPATCDRTEICLNIPACSSSEGEAALEHHSAWLLLHTEIFASPIRNIHKHFLWKPF